MGTTPAWMSAVVLAALVLVGGTARAAEYDEDAALKASQASIGRQLPDLTFRDTEGKTMRLSDFRGKPLLISLIYTSCAHSCLITTARLGDAVEVAHDALDEDSFTALTIGFDQPTDSPGRMHAYARDHGVHGVEGWHFLSGSRETLRQLMDTVGFAYYPSAGGFDHITQVTIVDAEGTIALQVYDPNFDTPQLVDPLKNLVFGTATPFASVTDLVKKVRLFCTIYDPSADRYQFDISLFIRFFAGTTFILFLSGVLVRILWKSRPRGKNGGPKTA